MSRVSVDDSTRRQGDSFVALDGGGRASRFGKSALVLVLLSQTRLLAVSTLSRGGGLSMAVLR